MAAILKWDLRGPACPIAGTIEKGQFGDELIRWMEDGTPHALADKSKALVMLPLGLIGGKPVFVGDELVDPSGAKFVPGPHSGRHLAGCRWPAPAKVYPTFTGDLDALRHEYNRSIGSTVNVTLEKVANAALRHAVDAGQVVPKDEHEAAMQRLGEHLKEITLADWAARDMTVAKAVRERCFMTIQSNHNSASLDVIDIDLAAIISTIK